MKDVADLGINASMDNYRLYKALSEFFAEAGEGQEVWIYGMPKTAKVSEFFTENNGVTPAEELLNSAGGRLRGLFTVRSEERRVGKECRAREWRRRWQSRGSTRRA